MFYKTFINNRKILLNLLKLKSTISEKREKIYALVFKVLKFVYAFESTDRFIYEHIHIDLFF